MRLQLALIDSHPDAKAIGNDIDEMEEMIDAYLAFAAGEGEEQPRNRCAGLLERLVEQAQKHINLISAIRRLGPLPAFPVRKNAIQRDFQISFQTPFVIQQNHRITAGSK